MTSRRGLLLLLAPAGAVFVVLLVLPLLNLAEQSFRLYIPGHVGVQPDAPYTLANYTQLLDPAYLFYFYDTFRLSLVASVIGLAVGYPIAFYLARHRSSRVRLAWIGFLVVMLFLSVLVRVYSLALTFGPIGFLRDVAGLLGLESNSTAMTEILVIFGLLHYNIPISALTLIGTIQNVNPRLVDAAESLGALRLGAHLSITLPLSARGIVSAFLICYTLSLSAFVIPMILGKGRVTFISNLIYDRFGMVANYQSGAALSIIMLGLSLVIIYGITRLATARWEQA